MFHMMKVISKDKFKTSLGTIFLVEGNTLLKTGEMIIIDDMEYIIKKIIMPTTPDSDLISVVV